MRVGRLLFSLVTAAVTLPAQPGAAERIDLAKLLDEGKLRAVNREVSKIVDRVEGVHMSERAGPGIVWIETIDFGQGDLEVEIRGRDRYQQSFVGIAFHGKDDNTYEAVYLRPFNFRAEDSVRHRHALQYMMVPDFDWPKLRQQFPYEFERPIAPSVRPTDWVVLRVAVREQSVDVFVGPDEGIVLSARKLGNLKRGMIGLWTGNGSDGDFANLRLTPRN